jgi:hypothetical protein
MDPRMMENTNTEHDEDFYLKNNFHPNQVRVILRHNKKLSEEQIDKFVESYIDKLQKVQKLARKLLEKVEKKYNHLPYEAIVQKAYAYAKHNNFTDAEKQALIRFANKGDVYNASNPYSQLKFTEMAKFFGFDATEPVLNIGNKDYAPLNEIIKLFELTRTLHLDIKNQSALYRDCAPEAITGKYDNTRHVISSHIHPVIVALFISKIPAIESRMILSNIGRIVAQRSLPFLGKNIPLYDNVLHGEMEAEMVLTCDIVKDPNSLAYFSNDTPITNMLKRFKIQTELWKNVLNLRQGRYYSKGYDENDGILGFVQSLTTYEWSVFDSPDLYNVQDEGTILRKLLAVFSLRPTLTQISSLSTNSNVMGLSNWGGYARTTVIQIPIINVKLPSATINTAINLTDAMKQHDWFIENKMIVPKSKAIIYSKDLVFFYANRRYQTSNVSAINSNFVYQCNPIQTWQVGHTAVNENELNFSDTLQIEKDLFYLRSVVMIYKPPIAEHVSVGCTTVIVKRFNNSTHYLHYNPLLANFKYINGDKYESVDPFSVMPETSALASNYPSFRSEAKRFGTIFVYACQP